MSSTSIPTTFSDLQTACANRLRVSASDTSTLTQIKRMLNEGLHDVHIQQNWPWAERQGILITHAPYTTGTVAISTSARTTVTGSSTLWNTAVTGMGFNNARAGGKMKFDTTDIYTVSSVGSDTAITLATRYIGDNALSGASYTYFEDEYALAADFWRTVDVRRFTSAITLPIRDRNTFFMAHPRIYTTGQPRECTLIEKGPISSTAAQPRLVLYPAPDRVYNLPYRYITTYLATDSSGSAPGPNMSSDTDEPIIPLRYRMVLVHYVCAHWYRDRKDDQRSQEANGEYTDLIRRMAGDVSPERSHPKLMGNRRDYLMGSAGYGQSGRRYATGTWFDDMRG